LLFKGDLQMALRIPRPARWLVLVIALTLPGILKIVAQLPPEEHRPHV
jgi:hypothetical protein